MALRIADDVLQRPLMCRVDEPLRHLVRDRPRHAHTLGSAEGQVEPGHRKRRLPRHTAGIDVCRAAPSRRPAQLLPRHRILQHPEHPEEVLLGDFRPDRDPVAVVQPGQSLAEEPARRGAGLGVVPSQRRSRMTGPVGPGDRRHEVAVTCPQAHPADRHRQRLGPHPRAGGVGRGVARATLHTGRTGHHSQGGRLSARRVADRGGGSWGLRCDDE